MNTQRLLELNGLGIIPGPKESVESFSKRAEYCLSLKKHLSEKLQESLGKAESAVEQVLPEGFAKISDLYGFSPDWIPVFFSDYQLTPWHGGCVWIFQVEEESPTSALYR